MRGVPSISLLNASMGSKLPLTPFVLPPFELTARVDDVDAVLLREAVDGFASARPLERGRISGFCAIAGAAQTTQTNATTKPV